jgi:LacI family transcriptional regulator
MTVSRVINGAPNVRPATREAVTAAITALDYVPNPAARTLASANLIRIGLLYSNPSAAYLSELLMGVLDQVSTGNVQLVVEKCGHDGDNEAVVHRLIKNGIDGLILPPPLCDSPAVAELLVRCGMPAVAIASGQPSNDLCAVSIDDRRAACEMTEYIRALGHQRIAIILGDANQTVTQRRFQGYRDALARSGLLQIDELVAHGLFTYRSGLDAAEYLLGLKDPPTAIFASNDDMAAATVAVAHRRGLDVPGDLTVCGFDDTALATTIWPELTTIRQPIAEMSRVAIEVLLGEVKRCRAGEQRKSPHVLIDFALIRRQSDAAPHGTQYSIRLGGR